MFSQHWIVASHDCCSVMMRVTVDCMKVVLMSCCWYMRSKHWHSGAVSSRHRCRRGWCSASRLSWLLRRRRRQYGRRMSTVWQLHSMVGISVMFSLMLLVILLLLLLLSLLPLMAGCSTHRLTSWLANQRITSSLALTLHVSHHKKLTSSYVTLQVNSLI